jgi:hypothetical protein
LAQSASRPVHTDAECNNAAPQRYGGFGGRQFLPQHQPQQLLIALAQTPHCPSEVRERYHLVGGRAHLLLGLAGQEFRKVGPALPGPPIVGQYAPRNAVQPWQCVRMRHAVGLAPSRQKDLGCDVSHGIGMYASHHISLDVCAVAAVHGREPFFPR